MRTLLLTGAVFSSATFFTLPALGQTAADSASQTAQTTPDPSASDQLKVVVVTAERETTDIEKTPISMLALSGGELSQLGAISMDAALRNVPGVVVQGQAKGFDPAIRGIGSDLPPGSGEGAVATNFDGVYDIRAEGAVLGYYDVDRIEVLRGPQGTLYGRNATAGVVNVISNDPVQKLEADGTLEYGSYHRLRAEGMVNVPLTGDLAARASFISMNQDGYLSNGQDDNVGSAGRIKLLYKPGETFSLLVGGEYTKLGGKGMGAVPEFVTPPAHPYVATDPAVDYNHYNGYKAWAEMKWDVGFGVLTVLPAYQSANDEEYGFFGGRGNVGSDPDGLVQRSTEVRLNSRPGSRINWVVGGYHYDYHEGSDGYPLAYSDGVYTVTPTFTFARYKAHSNAAFAQLTYALIGGLRLTGGARETWDWRYSGDNQNPTSTLVAGTTSSHRLDYKVGLEDNLTENTFAYASVTTGYRPGGINPTDGSTFRPETLTSYETGVKSWLFQRRAQVNADVYYYNYRDYQALDFYIGPTGPTANFSNVDKVVNYGSEIEAKALVTRDDLVSLSVAYLHATFRSPVVFHVDPVSPGVDEDGDVLPHSPDWTIVGSYQHIFDLGEHGTVEPRASVRYTSSEYVNPIETAVALQPSYWNEDVSLTYSPGSGSWHVTAYADNLSNQVVKTNVFVGYATLGAPRMIGVTLSAKVGE